ncbi:MAG: hypothetical protein A3G58_00375 [Candidatus Colwellbacteria bacterium RIFCSPLOWO2_12_FULL_46_17]|uniref:Uncharacterized protein n=1 Tax=Candidatus Colwellbacteria bacterium RIFCSPLOWO2_12_FULL_46_17 TaxID=1797695 RepID=A0A1G1ZDD0_9BACT|nr:MAG: hypothetical protein A3G58_00375 [Candidatus Colwellbacteria bacterium RIFCSPLOWO2_12_FULL_46_17]
MWFSRISPHIYEKGVWVTSAFGVRRLGVEMPGSGKTRRQRCLEGILDHERRSWPIENQPDVIRNRRAYIEPDDESPINTGSVLELAHAAADAPDVDELEEQGWDGHVWAERPTHDGLVYATEDELVEIEGFTHTFAPRGERDEVDKRKLPCPEDDGILQGRSPFDTMALRNMGILET